MPFRDTETHLVHILQSIDAIKGFLGDINFAAYQCDLKTRSAVERQLQNLTEAAFRLGGDAEKLCPLTDWRGIKGLGNALRHEYDVIDDEVIWAAVHDRMPPLRPAVQQALAELQVSRMDHPA